MSTSIPALTAARATLSGASGEAAVRSSDDIVTLALIWPPTFYTISDTIA
jgi:hypothetical protein